MRAAQVHQHFEVQNGRPPWKTMDFPCLFPMEISGIGAQATGRSARAGGNGTSPRAPPWCSHRRARADANLGRQFVGAYKQKKG